MADISLDAIYDIDLALTTTDTDPQQHATQQKQYTTLLHVVQSPAHADERVLSLACALLGRHAGLVPTLASSAATALLGLCTVPPARENSPVTDSLSIPAGDAAILEASLALPTVPRLALRVRKSAATALVKLAHVMIASASSSSVAVDMSACDTFRGQLTLVLGSLQEGEDEGVGKELGKAMDMLEQQLQQEGVVKESEIVASKAMSTNTTGRAFNVSNHTHNPKGEVVEGKGNPDEAQAETPATTAEAADARVSSGAPHVCDPSSAEEVLDVIKGAEEGGVRVKKEEVREEDDAVTSEQSVLLPCSDRVPEGHFDDDAGALMYHDHGEVTKGEMETKEGRKRESQSERRLTPSSSSHSHDATVAQDEDEEAKEGQISSTPPGSRNSIGNITEEAVDLKTQGCDRGRSSSSASSFSRASPRRASASTMLKDRNNRFRSRSFSRSVSRSRSRSMSWGSSRSNGSRSWSTSRSRSRSISRTKDEPKDDEKKHSSYGSSRNSNGSSSKNSGKKESSNRRAPKKTYNDDVETVEILKQTLAKLSELDGSMSPERGFYPDDLRERLSLSPRLWEIIYDGAKIVPNRSNRLYRSRVRRLIWYVEARLGLPSSLRALGPGEGLEGKRIGGREGGGGGYGKRKEEGRKDHERWGGRRGEERNMMPAAVADAVAGGAAPEVVEEQMECEEPTPFVAIKNLSSNFVSLDLLHLIQGCSPNYKVAPWDLLSLRRKGGRGGGVAYLTVGNVKLAQKICDGLEGRKFDGKRLRTEFTLGKPCRDVYVAGVGGMEGWRVREVMEEWGEVLRVEGKNCDRKEKDSDFAFVNYAETGDAVAAIKAIYRCEGEIETNIDSERLSLKATFRPFKGRSHGHGGGQGGREGGVCVYGDHLGGREGGNDRDFTGKRGGGVYVDQQPADGAGRFSRRGSEGKDGRGGAAGRHVRSGGVRSRSPVRRTIPSGRGSTRGRFPPSTSRSSAPFHHDKSNKGGRSPSRSYDSYDSYDSYASARSRSRSISTGRSHSRSRSFVRIPHEQLQQQQYQPRQQQQQQQPRFRRYSRSNSPGRLGGDMGGRRASVRHHHHQQRQQQKGKGGFNGGTGSSSSSSDTLHKPFHQSRKRNRSMNTRGGDEQQQKQHYHHLNNGNSSGWNGERGGREGGEPRKYQRQASQSPERRVSVSAAVAGAHTMR